MTRWVEGIQRLPCIVPWSEVSIPVDHDRRKRSLRKIAVVNLKKEPGGGEADYDELREAAQRDRNFISAQLSLYAPRLRDLLRKARGGPTRRGGVHRVYSLNDKDWKSTRRGVWYRIVDSTPHIAYHHPQARIRSNLVHYGLIDAVAVTRPIFVPLIGREFT